MPCSPGLAANIQPVKMRRDLASRAISSTSTKEVVLGFSVGGREKQTRGVICRAPNCTVSSIATSNETIRPVIFTLSLCGSPKTLEFLQWLGVDVPPRVSDMLRHSDDPLADSYRECLSIAGELIACCADLGVPFGFHVESVSIRKAEIEAAIDLATEVTSLLRNSTFGT